MSNAQARGGSVQMCSATSDTNREAMLAAVQQDGRALWFASAEQKADRRRTMTVVLAVEVLQQRMDL